jgi:hypothetical protein
LHWLLHPSEINGDNQKHIRNNKRKCLKEKINELAVSTKNKNIRDLSRGLNELGTISVDFDITDQLLIRFSAFVRYWKKKWEYNEAVHQLFIDFKKAYDQ